jgi:hypothetical protein
MARQLSQHAREELARAQGAVWFQELVEFLRYAATFAHIDPTPGATFSETEIQAMKGKYREGAASTVELLLTLHQEPKKPAEEKPPFGSLIPPTPDPKASYQRKTPN